MNVEGGASRSDPLAVAVAAIGEAVVVRVDGEIDMLTTPRLQHSLDELLSNRDRSHL